MLYPILDLHYWIDPNGNELDDEIQVHCKMETGETCIKSKLDDIIYNHHLINNWIGEVN